MPAATQQKSGTKRNKYTTAAEKRAGQLRKRTKYQSKMTFAKQEISPVPTNDINWDRREQCCKSLKHFCFTYFPNQFYLPWSAYHDRAAEKIEAAVDTGGFFAFAMPRGSGKTSLSRAGVLWAILRGSCEYVVLLSATDKAAVKQLKSIKASLWRNDLLFEDFPHAIYPFRVLDNEPRAATGQRYNGEKTAIEWSQNRVVFAWIPEEHNQSSGAVIDCMGMTGEIRGPLHTKPDGKTIRPQLVIADDPQTRSSAKSPTQSQTRLETLMGDVAYLNGPDKPVSVVCPCTVIYQDDLADQILDREKHPEWHGERTKMVDKFPDNQELWDQYADILRASWREDGDGSVATEFYKNNRQSMDSGAVVTWEARFDENELSALQHAMNRRIKNIAAFYAECQNEPIEKQLDELGMRPIDSICTHVTGHKRGEIPPDVTILTAFTDIQKEHFFWMLCGWTPYFTGFVIDYGAWPDQGRQYFARADVRHTLSRRYKSIASDDEDDSAMMFAALGDVADMLFKPRQTIDGRDIEVAMWCIDGGWEKRKPAMRNYIAQCDYKARIAVTHGFGVRAKERPFSQSPRLLEQRSGPAWYWTHGKRTGGDVTFDSNFWKTRAHEQLALPKMSKSSIQLFHADPFTHRMLAEHLHAEKPIRVDARGRTVYEWDDTAAKDNEGLDCLVGNLVAASIAGVSREKERGPKREAKTLAQLYGRK